MNDTFNKEIFIHSLQAFIIILQQYLHGKYNIHIPQQETKVKITSNQVAL